MLKPYEDASGKAKEMENEWIITEKVRIGKQSADGKVRGCSGLMIRPGDFVDVTAMPDIVTPPGKDGLKLNWNMTKVIQLKAGAVIKQVRTCCVNRTTISPSSV